MRRRFARRATRRLGRGMMGTIPPLLIRSNELISAGEFVQAADGSEELANTADARGGRRTARLYLEAGRARVRAAQGSRGLELIQRGLGLFAAAGLWRRLTLAGTRLAAEFDDLGFKHEAQQVRLSMDALTPVSDPASPGTIVSSRLQLPTHCPGCGAPLRPDEVEWLDEATAECEYCGTPVRGE
ncbi:MAG TPA: hypothetical protein VIU38_13100 [Anaerolineales bacterium]